MMLHMSVRVESQLGKWVAPLLIAALLSLNSFALSRILKNSETLAVLTSIVQEGKIQRDKAYDENTKEHKDLANKISGLVSKTELDVRVSELKTQMLAFENSIRAMNIQFDILKVEFAKLQLQISTNGKGHQP